MQHVSTYSSRLQAKLRTVIALQSGCAHLGSNMAYSILLRFFVSNVTYIYCAIISHIAYKKKPQQNTVSHMGSQMRTTTL